MTYHTTHHIRPKPVMPPKEDKPMPAPTMTFAEMAAIENSRAVKSWGRNGPSDFSAASQPILDILAHGPHTAREIGKMTGASQQTTCNRLARLKAGGRVKKDGTRKEPYTRNAVTLWALAEGAE